MNENTSYYKSKFFIEYFIYLKLVNDLNGFRIILFVLF